MNDKKSLIALLLLTTLFLGGCAVNPVTGDRELGLMSEGWELETGRKQYAPSRQMQGGDYKLDPELTRYVSQVGNRLAKVSDRKLPYEFVVLNDSTPNAWALPGGKIAINRGLLVELDSEAELAAVLGHEIVHAAARHGAKSAERGVMLQGAVLAAGVAANDSNYGQLAVGAAAVGANLINQRYSRGAELEADEYGMQYMVRAGYDPRAAIKLQETFVRLNENKQPNWLAGLFASHPPSRERVEKNRQMAAKLGYKGEQGRDRYQRRMAYLKRVQPAYEAYQEGRKALAEKKPDRALGYANKALGIESKEALFHSLAGDALLKKRQYSKARRAYDSAISHDDGFFRHYLQRGEVRLKQRDKSGARQDLERSLALLPTANAHYHLGTLMKNRDRAAALKHFKSAAQSRSAVGKEANKELLRLDLPANPDRYLKSRIGLSNGEVIVQIQNPTALTVHNVRVAIQRPNGAVRETSLRSSLAAGKSVNIRTGVKAADKNALRGWRAKIIEAVL